jgi:hypothetical protein
MYQNPIVRTRTSLAQLLLVLVTVLGRLSTMIIPGGDPRWRRPGDLIAYRCHGRT